MCGDQSASADANQFGWQWNAFQPPNTRLRLDGRCIEPLTQRARNDQPSVRFELRWQSAVEGQRYAQGRSDIRCRADVANVEELFLTDAIGKQEGICWSCEIEHQDIWQQQEVDDLWFHVGRRFGFKFAATCSLDSLCWPEQLVGQAVLDVQLNPRGDGNGCCERDCLPNCCCSSS